MTNRKKKKKAYDGPDFAAILEGNLEASGFYAVQDMRHGRLGCLAEHIRRTDFRIDRPVAEELLSLIDGSHSFFKLELARKDGLPAAVKNKNAVLNRDLQMMLAVERLSGFKRGKLKEALVAVGDMYGLDPTYVGRRVRRLRANLWEPTEE